MVLLFTFRIPLPHDSNSYLIEGFIFTGIRIPFITISYFTFLWTCIRLSYVLSVVAILCMHRSYRLFASLLMPIIAGTNTAFYLMILLPIQLYEYH